MTTKESAIVVEYRDIMINGSVQRLPVKKIPEGHQTLHARSRQHRIELSPSERSLLTAAKSYARFPFTVVKPHDAPYTIINASNTQKLIALLSATLERSVHDIRENLEVTKK